MDFSEALFRLKRGQQLTRRGWNGPRQFVVLLAGTEEERFGDLPVLAMRTVYGHMVPWVASQTDLLAEDWSVVSTPVEGVDE